MDKKTEIKSELKTKNITPIIQNNNIKGYSIILYWSDILLIILVKFCKYLLFNVVFLINIVREYTEFILIIIALIININIIKIRI